MRIGVFGDSFAQKGAEAIWYRYLETEHGHTVTSFGENGSSLSFSVNLIENLATEFDKIIWCVTSVDRISFWHENQIYHNTGRRRSEPTGDPILDHKISVVHNYIAECFDWHFQEILGQALVFYMASRYPQLTMIPCFPTPIYFQKFHQFNLFELCKREVEIAYPGQDLYSFLNSTKDNRIGHITKTNQKILARLINDKLDQPIFCIEYENFCFDRSVLKSEIEG